MKSKRKSKRDLVRDERRKRRREENLEAPEEAREPKRRRTTDGESTGGDLHDGEHSHQNAPEKEYFGMLADDEQEYFRRADELLELNDFVSPEDRAIFLENVYKEAEGKELKLASSQSCSRFMERLILLATTKQKKHLFEAFSGHFLTLATHRFASHCCEQLFIQSAPIVTQELSGVFAEDTGDGTTSEESSPVSMENLFMLMLDELEEQLTHLMSDKFASHTIRVILVVLSGRSLDQLATKSLLQSKKKEHIRVPGALSATNELNSQLRPVPESFTAAIQKIIDDTTWAMDATTLRVLAKHPTGNPVLQLLLELDIALNTKSKAPKASGKGKSTTLLELLLPGAPASLSDESSPASEFVNTMVYDPVGSRLLEALITHCPGKIFKSLYANIFGPRIQSFLRNDIACYPAIKVLSRLSREDLVNAVDKILPTVPALVEKSRFSVLSTLFERCSVRNADTEIEALLTALSDACGSDDSFLVPKLCFQEEEPRGENEAGSFKPLSKTSTASVSHGCHLLTTLLGIRGKPSRAVRTSLLSLPPESALLLATSSTPTVHVLVTALKTPSPNPVFHKSLVAAFQPHVMDLAGSQFGHNFLNAIVTTPSKGDGIAVAFHQKEAIMTRLAEHEAVLRDSWTGRSVWRTWRGDLWKRRRTDWIRWAKEVDPESARTASTPHVRDHGGQGWQREKRPWIKPESSSGIHQA